MGCALDDGEEATLLFDSLIYVKKPVINKNCKKYGWSEQTGVFFQIFCGCFFSAARADRIENINIAIPLDVSRTLHVQGTGKQRDEILINVGYALNTYEYPLTRLRIFFLDDEQRGAYLLFAGRRGGSAAE